LALVWLVRRRSIRIHWGGFALAAGAFVAAIALWIYLQFGADSSPSLILSMYATPYHTANLSALIVTNILRFFTESTPIYTAASVVLWVVSMVIRKKKNIAITTAEMTCLFFCGFILLAYLRLQGWYRYFFPATVLGVIFIPYSVTAVFQYISERVPLLRKAMWVPYAAVLLLVVGQLYQLDRDSYVAQYYKSTNTRDAAAALSALGTHASVFLYNTPELAILLTTPNYYQYLTPSPYTIGAEELPALQSGAAQYVVAPADTYQNDPTLFPQYVLSTSFGKYDLFKKK
jgi:hypothetical protein